MERAPVAPSIIDSTMPMIPLIGVLSSWDVLARNSSFMSFSLFRYTFFSSRVFAYPCISLIRLLIFLAMKSNALDRAPISSLLSMTGAATSKLPSPRTFAALERTRIGRVTFFAIMWSMSAITHIAATDTVMT